jgi:hypothetical protein
VHGKQVLDVSVSDQFSLTKVDYFLSGLGLARTSIATAISSSYGWIAIWNTSAVPNGSYTIDATVDDSGGRSVRTSPVEVRADNAQSISEARLR